MRTDEYGPVYTPEEIESMHRAIGVRLRGVMDIADKMDVSDPDRLAEKAWLVGTVKDITEWFDMQDAAIRRSASNQESEPK